MRRAAALLLAAAALACAARAAPQNSPAAARADRHDDAPRGASSSPSPPSASSAAAARDPANVARRAFGAAVGALPIVTDARTARAEKAATRTANDAAALAAYLQDPEVKTILLARDVELSDAAWAPVGSAVVTRRVLVAPVNGSGRVAIDFGRLVSAVVLVGDRARLTFDRVWLRNLAPRSGARQEGLARLRPAGLSLWPSVVTLPNTTLVLADARVDVGAEDGFSNCTAFGARVRPDAEAAGFQVYMSPDGRDAQLAGTLTLAQPLYPPGDGAAPVGNATVVSTNTVLSCVPAPARPGRPPTKLVALPPVNASGAVADPPTAAAMGGPTSKQHSRLKWWSAVLLAVCVALILVLAVGVAVLARRLRRLQRQRSARRAAKAAGGAGVGGGASTDEDGDKFPCSDAEAGSIKKATTPAASVAPLPLLLRARSADAATDIELGPLLGRGSYGRVYKARWKGTLVAVKVVPADDLDAPAAARESALALAATHPNVVATYKVLTLAAPPEKMGMGMGGGGDDGDRGDDTAEAGPDRAASLPGAETWIVLEYMDRGTLEAAIRGGRFARPPPAAGAGAPPPAPPPAPAPARDAAAAWACLKDVAAGLAYLHSIGVMHGDLSAANVLLRSTASDPRGFVCKVSDFGLSRVLDARASHVSTKTYGTVRAMPPELLRDGRMTRGADVYAFGVLAWEVWAGAPAYDGLPTAAIFYKVAVEGGRPPPLAGAPPELNELCAQCWAPDPDARPTFDAIVARLAPLAAAARAAARPARGGGGGGGGGSTAGGSASGPSASTASASPPPPPPAPVAAPPVAAPTPFAAPKDDGGRGGGVWGRLPSWGRRASGGGGGKAGRGGGKPPKPPKR